MSPEPALADLASEVEDARGQLLKAARTKPDYPWTVKELTDLAKGDWRDTVVMIALDQLLANDALKHDPEWHVLVRE